MMTSTSPSANPFPPLTTLAFEVLLAVAEHDSHGYDIMLSIERRTDGAMSPNPGTLYRALDRLVSEGLLDTFERSLTPSAEPRKHFRLTKLGARVVAAEASRLADQVAAARRLLKRPRGAS